jgi:phospholipid/cholesterol/gamma-HCH transport system substrate-binding protein
MGAAGALCTAALAAAILLSTAAGGSSGGYTVRAIFDEAGNLIPGEDVLVDGVKVGIVGEVVPTPQAKAAATLEIENPGFQDFRADAQCTIKIQSLIGEKNVDCLPTQPRPYGAPLPKPLPVIPKGHEGAGQRYLSVEHTSSPVDVDLVGDISRRPERERLSIILNELGAGLAGRGSDLNAVIRRANPALREVDAVLGILASENKVLANLAEEGDRVLEPWAKVRSQVADFIVQANTVSTAQARHRGALEQNLALLPAFLRQLGPAMRRLGEFGEQAAPALTSLGLAAPGLAKTFQNLGPFSTTSTKYFESLGKSAKITGPALVAAQPFFKRFQALGAAAKPFAENAAGLTSSVRDTGGIERLVDTIFNSSGAINGYDALGHFLRGILVVNTCQTYAVAPTPGCNSKLSIGGSSASTAAVGAPGSSATTELVMQRTLAVLEGATPAQAIARYPGTVTAGALGAFGGLGEATPTAQPVGGSSGGTTYYTPASENSSASGLLLNYLLGN